MEDTEHDSAEENSGREESNTGFKAMKKQLAPQDSTPVASRDTKSVQKLLEEYNKLQYEDIVAGQPTKFRYQTVNPGLSLLAPSLASP